jgi:sulfate/thiosulfate transport system substrate-binding protein
MRSSIAGWKRVLAQGAVAASFLFLTSVVVLARTAILNVPYNVSRELYEDINPTLIADWKAKTGNRSASMHPLPWR